jgi:N-acetyl-anhydromuramyl-L-alanine amidase AmpD
MLPFVGVLVALLAAAPQAFAVKPDYVRIVGNQSSREGSKPGLVVLHVTTDANSDSPPVVRDRPGLKDLKELGAWFDDPQSAVSSHVANDADGNDAQYVRDRRKAWTQVAFNSVSLSIEQIGTTGFDRRKWRRKREPQLENTARWIAHWHRKWSIPIRRAKVSGDVVVRSGVATHEQLGQAGGGHHDPGPGYPFGHVLKLARSFNSHSMGT